MNLHATAVALGRVGCLIEGPSGAGKTSLALAAIEYMRHCGTFAALVADDQCLIEIANGRVVARCPPALMGLVEIRGLGLIKCPAFSPVIIDLVIRLSRTSDMERMPETQTTAIAGVQLPVFMFPARQIAVSLPLLCQIIENRRL